MYDPNGYTAGNVPLSSYPPQATAGMGYQPSTPDYSAMGNYQAPSNSGYNPAQSSAQYSLGGGGYDIQPQGATTPPVYSDAGQSYANNTGAYANNTGSYANNTGAYANNANTGMYAGNTGAYANNTGAYGNTAGSNSMMPGGAATSPYQVPTMPSQGSGYDPGLVQEPYPSQGAPAYPGMGASSDNSYSANPSGYTAESAAAGSVASLPTLPALPSGYTNTQPAYEPGKTGFQPQGVPEYQVPTTGGYVQQATATETEFAPGSISRYPSASTQNNTSTGAAQLGSYGTAGALY